MPIEAYLQNHLIPQLSVRGMDDDQIHRVADDVGRRLASVLSRWNDGDFREAILVLGEEEAAFWEPEDVDLAIRSLVVVGVRNSLVEDLSSTTEAARGLGLSRAVLPDGEMPLLTREAIRYFDSVELEKECRSIAVPPPPQDVYGPLQTKYPLTWRALTELSELPHGEAAYAPLAARAPALAVGRPVDLHLTTLGSPRFLSGMAAEIEPELQRLLRLARSGIYPGLFSDSFKTITRNPQKLFAVMEFVLAHGQAVITHNYYLRNGYVARRTPLVRPAHTVEEIQAKFQDYSGLLPGHAEAITRYAPARA
ncbi:MAG TPA: hypothetical protein VFZ25_00685 [Chloroflexota bacterium]|nr:hypothetical protein [Chloroflexota bacterium]